MIILAKQCVIMTILIQMVNLKYAGEEFPVKYLEPDGEMPSDADVELYLDKLKRMTKYLTYNMNDTDINQAFSAFMSTAVLKRILIDYSNKMEKYTTTIKALIHDIANLIAHYRYNKNVGGWENAEYKMAKALQDDTATVYSLRNFNRGVLKKWLLKFVPINDYVLSMDRLSLSKEKYVELVEDTTEEGGYEITGPTSDRCLSRLAENIDVLDNTTLHPCKMDELCKDKIFAAPSVAYSLSHRLFNNMMYFHTRRCYHYSPEYDLSHMDMLCSAMYRETVYLARRGYFARDVFMEHIGFCGQLGYEEFHRPVWFRKTANWIDEKGCMQEDSNFEFNRTKLIIATTATDSRETRRFWRMYHELMDADCHHHQMAVAMMALVNAVRHAAHFMEDPIDNLVHPYISSEQ